mgnify:CR=1 FL=1
MGFLDRLYIRQIIIRGHHGPPNQIIGEPVPQIPAPMPLKKSGNPLTS